MRFSLRLLLILLTAAAIYAGIVFAIPPRLGFMLLSFFSLLMPAIYLGGLFYSRRYWKAFWIGTVACGIIPTICTTYMGVTLTLTEGYFTNILSGDTEPEWTNVAMAVTQLAPALGGLVTIAMRRLYKSDRSLINGCCLVD